MERMRDDDWVVFTDGDTIQVQQFYGNIIEAAIAAHPEAGLFTAYTNRVGVKWQVHPQSNWKSSDIEHHKALGAKLANERGGQYTLRNNETLFAGFAFVVSVKAWKAAGGFSLQGIYVDSDFYRRVRNAHFDVYSIESWYVYHDYRGGKKGGGHLVSTPVEIANPVKHGFSNNNKLCIYSAAIGGYDAVRKPKHVDPFADYYVFTDEPEVPAPWRKLEIPQALSGYDSYMQAKMLKLLPHRYLPKGYEYSLWQDANLVQQISLSALLNAWEGCEFGNARQAMRNCVFDEINACVKVGKDSIDKLQAAANLFHDSGMSRSLGLYANGHLYRKHNSPKVVRLMEKWAYDSITITKRDQVTLPYTLRMFKGSINHRAVAPELIYGNRGAYAREHHKPTGLKPKVQKASQSLTVLFLTIGRDTLEGSLKLLSQELQPQDTLTIATDYPKQGDNWQPYVERVVNAMRPQFACEVVLHKESQHNGWWGHDIRNKLQKNLQGDWIYHMDDDDMVQPGFRSLLNSKLTTPDTLHAFSFRKKRGDKLFQYGVDPDKHPFKYGLGKPTEGLHPWIIAGNVSGQCVVVPNEQEHLGEWKHLRTGDYEYIKATALSLGRCEFHNETLVTLL